MAATSNLFIAVYQSEDVIQPCQLTSTTADISTWTMTLTIRNLIDPRFPFSSSVPPIVIFTSTAAITNGLGQQFQFAMSSAQLTIPATDYSFDVRRTDTGNNTVWGTGVMRVTATS